MLGNVEGKLDHSTRFILIDQQGRVRRYYDTTEPNMISEAVRDVRELTSGGVS
jgi:cytochrome oxidase Cu insertion factor (SCO1/SenC/PrrC family)